MAGVKRLYPDARLAIGPAIDNGFYYDFDTAEPFTVDDLSKIEAEMKKIVKESLEIRRYPFTGRGVRAYEIGAL